MVCGGSYAAFAEETTNLTTTNPDQYEAPASTDEEEDRNESTNASTVGRKQERDNIISYHFSPAVAAGTEITVSDADGNVVFSATAQTDISMICFSSENLEDGEYTIKAGTGEDTIIVSSDQFERNSRHGKPDGREMMPKRSNQQSPDTNSGSTAKMASAAVFFPQDWCKAKCQGSTSSKNAFSVVS